MIASLGDTETLDKWVGKLRASLRPAIKSAMFAVTMTGATWKSDLVIACQIEAQLALDSPGSTPSQSAVAAMEQLSIAAMQPRGRQQEGKQRSKFQGKCYHCGKIGHRQAECHARA